MYLKQLCNSIVVILSLFSLLSADDSINPTLENQVELQSGVASNAPTVELKSIESIPKILIGEPLPKKAPPNYIPKKKGLYTKDDWADVIDATWGEGLSTMQKAEIWQTVWTKIDSYFPCFRDLDPDIWDNIWNRYDSEILGGVSAGRFYAILCHSALALRETHTFVRDYEVFSTTLMPGIPIMYCGDWGYCGHFGAALTPLPDKSLLVYKVIDDHPLGLDVGDIVLGYDGVAWKDLYPALIEAELPFSGIIGSSASAYEHAWLMAAGRNWHLFDEINIKKYGTDEIQTLPTSLLIDMEADIWGTEQLEVPGIQIPECAYGQGECMTFGKIDGTEIGYIYVATWGTATGSFLSAVASLADETTGLILDFRTNYGGDITEAYPGLWYLFNEYTETIGFGVRGGDHFEMQVSNEPWQYAIYANPGTYYGKPIAVLVGPGAVSAGDQIALAMAFHPMAKFFGKPTTAAFTGPKIEVLHDRYLFYHAGADAFLAMNPEQYLTREEFPSAEDFPWVDYEHVWLTRDGVAEGRDDVVEAAKAWIVSFDVDQDGVFNEVDNCPNNYNPDQADTDGDDFADACDNCPDDYNPEQVDSDDDGTGDMCEYICGDTDDNGIFDVLDIVLLIDHKFKDGSEPVRFVSGDIDMNGVIDILDIVYMIDDKFKDSPMPECS